MRNALIFSWVNKRLTSHFGVAFIVLACLGCGSDKTAGQHEGVLTDAQTKALEKAKETEDALRKAAEERAKSLGQ